MAQRSGPPNRHRPQAAEPSATPRTTAPLSPHWAFVVQLREGTPLTPAQLTGRVEQIVSGQATPFASLAELVAFMIQVLTPRQTEPMATTSSTIDPTSSPTPPPQPRRTRRSSQAREPPPASPVVEAFRTQWRGILRMAGLNVLTAVGFQTLFVYAVTYLEQIMHVQVAEAFDLNTFNMGVLLLVMPAAGALSDRVGRKPLLLGPALGVLALAWPLFWLMHHPIWSMMLVGQLGFAMLPGVFIGVLPATMAEAVPARVRVSVVSIAYNLALGVLGGTTPMVVTHLIAWSHDPLAPAYYLMGAAAVSLVVLLRWRETDSAPIAVFARSYGASSGQASGFSGR